MIIDEFDEFLIYDKVPIHLPTAFLFDIIQKYSEFLNLQAFLPVQAW